MHLFRLQDFNYLMGRHMSHNNNMPCENTVAVVLYKALCSHMVPNIYKILTHSSYVLQSCIGVNSIELADLMHFLQ